LRTAQNTRLGTRAISSVGGETVKAFIPPPLPPQPAVELTGLVDLLDRATAALGRLDGITTVLPAPPLFIYMYVRKEALLSSQIEGTQSSLSDLLLFESEEIPQVPVDDVEEVSSYVAALNHGLRRIRKDGFPVSLRLIREIHGVLLRTGRGSSKQPGEFRRTQNWIGGTRPGNAAFVPPPPERLYECLDAFERFLHEDHPGIPLLVRAALVHVQFETIHPFLDGNGRLGRLLITFLLCAAGALQEPSFISVSISRRIDNAITSCFRTFATPAIGKHGSVSSSKACWKPPRRRSRQRGSSLRSSRLIARKLTGWGGRQPQRFACTNCCKSVRCYRSRLRPRNCPCLSRPSPKQWNT
jgi:Fic/DOC family protein